MHINMKCLGFTYIRKTKAKKKCPHQLRRVVEGASEKVEPSPT